MIQVTAAEADLLVDALNEASRNDVLADLLSHWHRDQCDKLGALVVRLAKEAKAEHDRAARDMARAQRRGEPLVGVKPNSPARSLIRDRGPRRGKR